MLLLQPMIVLFIYIAIGYGAAKKGIMDESFSKKISWVVINVANPALTLSAVVNGEGTIKGKELLLTAIVALVILGGMVLLSLAMPFLFRVKKEQRGIYRLMSAFNNIGFMGFPVIMAVYGQEALLYAAIFTMLFNVLIYTYGIQTIQKEAKGIEWGKIFNIGVVSSILAIVLYLMRIPTPEFFNMAMSGLSGLTAPLSMMVIGIYLSEMRLKELFLDTRLLLFYKHILQVRHLLVPLFDSSLALSILSLLALLYLAILPHSYLLHFLLFALYSLILHIPFQTLQTYLILHHRLFYILFV